MPSCLALERLVVEILIVPAVWSVLVSLVRAVAALLENSPQLFHPIVPLVVGIPELVEFLGQHYGVGIAGIPVILLIEFLFNLAENALLSLLRGQAFGDHFFDDNVARLLRVFF